MNSRSRILIAAIALTLTGTAVWFLCRRHEPRLPSKAPQTAAASKPASPVAAPAAAPAQPPAPIPPQQADEVAATARMYLAHAPLRTPEVSDPDSAANRQILQTMVGKALGKLPPPAPKVPSTP